MGVGTSTSLHDNITFEFDKKYTTIYKTGETVSGKVIFKHDGQIELRLKSIMIILAGEIVYYSARGPALAKSTDIHVCPILTDRQIARSSNGADSFILEPKEHTWPFSFRLDTNLPSTLEQTRLRGPYIRYVIRVHFVQPEWYKKDIQKASFLTVQYHSIPQLPNDHTEESQNNRKVHLRATLHENIVIPGEKCPLSINLYNPNRLTITRLSMVLIQYQQLGDAGKDEITVLKKDLYGIDNFQGEQWQNTFHIQIPDKIVASYSAVPTQWSSRKALVIRYELHLEAHVQGQCPNTLVHLPFAVAHVKEKKIDQDPLPPKYEKLFLV